MKRTTLALLLAVMIVTPCFAQELEPDGLFSIEGTRWEALPIGIQIFPLPKIWYTKDLWFGFYGDKGPFYIDMLACSIFWQVRRGSLGVPIGRDFGILQPIGIGMVVRTDFISSRTPFPRNIGMAILIKTDDNWAFPEFGSISPNQGEQGTTLTSVTITGINTTFEDDSPFELRFAPPDGLTVSNINVKSDTEIEFNLEIAVDAQRGVRDVWMLCYDNDFEYLIKGNNVFEVLEKPF